MANLDELKANLESATSAMTSLGQQTVSTNKYADGLVKSLSDLASMKGKGGTIWSLIGRYSSGSALYNIQNKLRSITVFARLLTETEKNRIEQVREYNKALEEQGGLLKSGLDTYMKINKGLSEQKDGLFEIYSRLDTVTNSYLKQYDFQELINMRQGESIKLIKTQLGLERKIVEEQGKGYKLGKNAQKIMGKSGFSGKRKGKRPGDFIASLTGGGDFYESKDMSKQLLNLSDELQFFTGVLKDEKETLKVAMAKETQLKEELNKINEEEKKIKLRNMEIEQEQRKLNSKTPTKRGKGYAARNKAKGSLSEETQTQMELDIINRQRIDNEKKLQEMAEERAELNKTLDENKQKLNKEQVELIEEEVSKRKELMGVLEEDLEERGVQVTKSSEGEVTDIQRTDPKGAGFFKSLIKTRKSQLNAKEFGKGIKTLGKPISALFLLMKSSFLDYLTKKNFSKLFTFARTGIIVFAQIIYAVTLLGLLVFLLHKSGFIDGVLAFIEENKGAFINFKEMAIKGFMGLYEFLNGFFNLVVGLFSGDGSQVMSGLTKMKDGLIEVLTQLVPAIVVGITLIVASLGSGVFTMVYKLGEFIVEGMRNIFNDLRGSAKKAVAGASMGMLGTAIGFAIGGPPGAIAGGIIGAGIGFGMNKTKGEMAYGAGAEVKGMFASGGIVSESGKYLVGEKGPEIVNLPTGARVFNNNQSKSMMGSTTINVSVNGRLGASDTELDDIARKIGRKINLEMNRYNNSGYRA